MRILWKIGKRYFRLWICCRGEPINNLAQRKWNHTDPIEKGMIMGMVGSQGVWVGTIIPQSNALGDLVQFQGQGVAQVCLMLGGKEEFLRQTFCKVKSGISNHQLLMVIIEREERSRHGCWKWKNILSFMITPRGKKHDFKQPHVRKCNYVVGSS